MFLLRCNITCLCRVSDFVKFLCEVDQPDYFQVHYPAQDKARKMSQAKLSWQRFMFFNTYDIYTTCGCNYLCE